VNDVDGGRLAAQGGDDGPGRPRPDPATIRSQDDLRTYLVALMSTRQSIRAVESDTRVSKTTLAELRRGDRRPSRDVVAKIVHAYAPDERDAADAAWRRVQAAAPQAGDERAVLPDVAVYPNGNGTPGIPVQYGWPVTDVGPVSAPLAPGGYPPSPRHHRVDLRLVVAILLTVIVIETTLLIILWATGRPPPPPPYGGPPPSGAPGAPR
jgi:hypothetical protein